MRERERGTEIERDRDRQTDRQRQTGRDRERERGECKTKRQNTAVANGCEVSLRHWICLFLLLRLLLLFACRGPLSDRRD